MASEGFTTDDDDDLAMLEFVAKEPAEALGIEREATDKILHNKRVRRYLLKPKTTKARIFCLSFWFIVIGGLAALTWWLTPIVLKNIVVPIQTTVQKWNPVAVSFLVIGGIIVIPVILIPAGPLMWLAAVSLGVWKGFLVVQIGTAINMSLTYFLGRILLRDRIRRMVEHKDWAQALFIAVKEAGPFKVVLLMRLGPAPYSLLSYTCSLSPDIRFWPYIGASIIGRSLHNIIDIYIGTGVSTAGEAASGQDVDPVLITFYTVGFVFSVALSLWAYFYAKRTLRELRARALAREQVLNAFSFPEMEDDGFESDPNLERSASVGRRKSFRGSRRDLGFTPDEDKGLLAETELVFQDSQPHTPLSSSTPKYSDRGRSDLVERKRSGSLDSKLSNGLRTIVIADSSTQAEPENDKENLLEGSSRSS